jgi:hypothetical protein
MSCCVVVNSCANVQYIYIYIYIYNLYRIISKQNEMLRDLKAFQTKLYTEASIQKDKMKHNLLEQIQRLPDMQASVNNLPSMSSVKVSLYNLM